MIPAEAVEAAAKVLLGYTGACVCHEAYTGRNLIDPDCRFHDVPPEVAKEILEAAAPHLMAVAWDEAIATVWDGENVYIPTPDKNPYREGLVRTDKTTTTDAEPMGWITRFVSKDEMESATSIIETLGDWRDRAKAAIRKSGEAL